MKVLFNNILIVLICTTIHASPAHRALVDDSETESSSARHRTESAPSSNSVRITTTKGADGEIKFFENGKFFATASPRKHDKTIFDYLTPVNWRDTRRKLDHSRIGIKWATLTPRQKALYFTLDSYMALSGLLEGLKLIPGLSPTKYILANHHPYTVGNIRDSFKKIITSFPGEALERKVAELEGRTVPTVSASDESAAASEEAAASASSADTAASASSAAGSA